MSARNTRELHQNQIRSTALMHELMWRTGSTNPHQFAGWLDQLTHSNTQDSGKWRANFAGARPLSKNQLDALSQIFTDAHSHYQNGPCDLWRALWGETSDFIACIRSHPKSSPQMPFSVSEQAVQLSIITAAENDISFADFVRAIALYQLRKETEPFARIDGIGLNLTGTVWRDIQSCLKESKVIAELDRLGLKRQVTAELEKLEAERRGDNPKARFFD
ncbi:hypothetical protein [Pseudomonas paraeruginosa]|uniref:hypothetical protein n=1 Tax=Pseudomonas paraeruginosa TaxID=2994495 RepID=UPI0039FCA445